DSAIYFTVYRHSQEGVNEIAQDLNDGDSDPADPNLGIPEETSTFIDDLSGQHINADVETVPEVLGIDERGLRVSEKNLISATNVVLTRDTRENINDNNFSRIRLNLASAGNLLSGIAKLAGLEKNSSGNYETLGVAYSQYAKA